MASITRSGEKSLSLLRKASHCLRMERASGRLRHFLSATWTLAGLTGLVITIFGVLFAEPLVRVFAPGFALEPGKLELCATLLRLCFPYIFFLTLVAVAMGALNALGHFFAPAIAPVLLNLCLIAAALTASSWWDPPVVALGWADFARVCWAGTIKIKPESNQFSRVNGIGDFLYKFIVNEN